MKVIFFGYEDAPIIDFMRTCGDKVNYQCHGIPEIRAWDWIVVYGYRSILSAGFLQHFPGRCINLHISYLPWGRGADPNLWAWVNDEPHGVTIHELDAGVDTGPIICQRVIEFYPEHETLRTSYDKLRSSVEDMFYEWWPSIRERGYQTRPQLSGGSVHRQADRTKIMHLIADKGYDTPVTALRPPGIERPRI